MADPVVVSVTGEIAAKSVTGTITAVSVSANINEYGWYGFSWYKDFSAAGLAGYQISDFPDIPMDSPLLVYNVTSAAKDPNSYGDWET